jgi:hypothetical protein
MEKGGRSEEAKSGRAMRHGGKAKREGGEGGEWKMYDRLDEEWLYGNMGNELKTKIHTI